MSSHWPTTYTFNDLAVFARQMTDDLNALRAGRITISDANTRARLAREALRALELGVATRRMLEGAATPVDQPRTVEADIARAVVEAVAAKL